MLAILKEIYGSLLFVLFRIFPLQNKVVFSSFSGKNYEGNPKYISDYLLENRKDIKQVWINHTNNKFKLSPNIKVVKWGSPKMVYEMATAKVWVDSHTKPKWIKKRKKQFYIETWHGGLGMKKIEYDAADKFPKNTLKNIKHNSNIADLFISNSKHLTDIYKRAFYYEGSILESGFPKNDIFFKSEEELYKIRTKVLEHFNISNNKKILLYAPTFRNNFNLDVYNIDFKRVKTTLEDKYNKEYIILYRLHPFMKDLANKFKGINNEDIIDATYYDDMQELIIATDIFITDYSSGIFDFAELKRPGFLYATDINSYENERGLYFDLEKLPFPLSQNNDELIKNIENFNYNIYIESLEKFFKAMELKDNANSVKTISNIIEKYIEKGEML